MKNPAFCICENKAADQMLFFITTYNNMSIRHVTTKPVIRVSDQVRHKLEGTATNMAMSLKLRIYQ